MRNCYYNCSRLQKFVYDGATEILLHTFVATKWTVLKAQFEKEGDQSKGNFVCFVGIRFAGWLHELAAGDDDWLKCNALFVLLVKDFFTFVDSYRCGDAIGIETGYETFVVIWRALGQCHYELRHWRQQEDMYVKHPYHFLEWV